MKNCPYCGYSNYDNATECRKCDNSFDAPPGTVYGGRRTWIGPLRGRYLRDRALSLIVLGLLMRVYWGGYGPWPTIDFPILVSIRAWLEPLLLYGGVGLYTLGLLGRWI